MVGHNCPFAATGNENNVWFYDLLRYCKIFMFFCDNNESIVMVASF
jgi:hypothetical protein